MRCVPPVWGSGGSREVVEVATVLAGLLVGYLVGRVRRAITVERDRELLRDYRQGYRFQRENVRALLDERRVLLTRMHDYQKHGLVLYRPHDEGVP